MTSTGAIYLGNTLVAGGADGKSAYEIAVAAGYSGTESEWLESLSVEGLPGLSAYQLAVKAGYSGTESEWLESLSGADGQDGANGRGIVSVERTSGDGSAGSVDTYTISFTDNTTSTFQVRNGSNGTNSGSAGAGSATLDGLADVDTSTTPPTNGQALVWREMDQLWVPGSVASSGGGATLTPGVVLIENGGSVPAATPVNSVVFEKGSPRVSYDFTKGALPAGIARYGNPVPTEAFAANGMSALLAQGKGYSALIPAGYVDFIAEVEVVAQTSFGGMVGVSITDDTGAGWGAAWYNNPSGMLMLAQANFAYPGGFSSAGGTPAVPARIRLRKQGENYDVSWSTDNGGSWAPYAALRAWSGVPTRINFGNFADQTVTSTLARLMVIQTSAFPGGLRGWWDGSAIQPMS